MIIFMYVLICLKSPERAEVVKPFESLGQCEEYRIKNHQKDERFICVKVDHI